MVAAGMLFLAFVGGCGEAERVPPPAVDSTSALILEDALAAIRAGDYGRATILVERAEARQPGLTEADFIRGQIFFDLGLYDRAEVHWQRVRDAEPDYWLWAHNLGDLAFREARFEDAAGFYRTASELDPTNPVSLHGLANAFWEMGLPDSTGAVLERALSVDPEYAPLYLTLSDYAEEQGDVEAARVHVHRALELDSTETEYHLAAGVLDFQISSFDEAIGHLERVLAEDPANHAALYNYGRALQRTGESERGQEILEAAEVAREQDRALQLLRDAVANNPTSPGNQMALARALHGTGRIEEALRAYKAADLLSPGSSELRHTIATLHLQRGDLDEAAMRYRAIIASDTTFPEAWLNLGLAYARMDSMDRARAVWREAGVRFPDHPAVRQVLARIDNE